MRQYIYIYSISETAVTADCTYSTEYVIGAVVLIMLIMLSMISMIQTTIALMVGDDYEDSIDDVL